MPARSAPQSSIAVGDIRITSLPDGEAHFAPTGMIPGSDEAAWQGVPHLLDDDGWYVTTLGGFLVQTGDRSIVVDLGFGEQSVEVPGFARASGGRLVQSLRYAGVSPEEVDTVVYTHLHSDHTGWTTTGEGRTLTFPNATHLIGSEAEWTFWRDHPEVAFAPDPDAVSRPLEGRVEAAGDGRSVVPGVDLIATPGHTPGHQSVVVSSGAARAVILGDVLHCPLQITTPEWGVVFDVDPDLARRTRERQVAELEGTSTLVGCSHFPEAVFGRVLTGEGRRLWQAGA